MRSVDVERQLAQDREVFGSVVLSRPVSILCEVDVERPMEPVLDAPMTACDLQESFRRHVSGQEVMAHERRGGTKGTPGGVRGRTAHTSHTETIGNPNHT